MGPIDIQADKTPYFLNVSKIREVIYVTEGACTLRSYKGWRNSLYQAGYANAIAQQDERRLLTLAELEHAGRYFWGNVFSESSKQEITIDKAMSIVQFNYRIAMELVPKTVIPKGAPLKRETPGGNPLKPGVRIKRVGKERKGKKRSLLHHRKKKQLYRIKGEQKLMPFYEHGYNNTGGKNPDPHYERQKRLPRAKMAHRKVFRNQNHIRRPRHLVRK